MITRGELFKKSRVGKFIEKIEEEIDDELIFCIERNIRFLSILVYNYQPATSTEQEIELIKNKDENHHVCNLNFLSNYCDNMYKPTKKIIELYKALGYDVTEESVEEGLFKFTFDLNEVLALADFF